MAVGRRLQFLITRASPQCCLSALTAWWLTSPRMGGPGESREESAAPALTQSLRIHTLTATLFVRSDEVQPILKGRGIRL